MKNNAIPNSPKPRSGEAQPLNKTTKAALSASNPRIGTRLSVVFISAACHPSLKFSKGCFPHLATGQQE